jgi:flagellar basal-body rod protein FlgC
MNLFGMLELSGSALTAERLRAEVVTANMANAETTRTPAGGPYRRQLVVFRAQRDRSFPSMMTLAGIGLRSGGAGVRVDQIIASAAPPVKRYQPGHPDAGKDGYVSYPAIDPVEETADLLGAVRAYELNASAVQAAKGMIQQSLNLLQ